MKKQLGFTLLELILVASIISILAAIAMPDYILYTTRTASTEALTISEGYRIRISEFYRFTQRFPVNNLEIGIDKPVKSKYVKKIDLENGVIQVYYSDEDKKLAGKIISIRPLITKDSLISPVSWLCGNANVPDGMEAVGENKTTIEDKYIVSSCRLKKP